MSLFLSSTSKTGLPILSRLSSNLSSGQLRKMHLRERRLTVSPTSYCLPPLLRFISRPVPFYLRFQPPVATGRAFLLDHNVRTGFPRPLPMIGDPSVSPSCPKTSLVLSRSRGLCCVENDDSAWIYWCLGRPNFINNLSSRIWSIAQSHWCVSTERAASSCHNLSTPSGTTWRLEPWVRLMFCKTQRGVCNAVRAAYDMFKTQDANSSPFPLSPSSALLSSSSSILIF